MGGTATPFGESTPIPDPLAQFLSRVMAEVVDSYVNIHAFGGSRATYHGGGRAFAGMVEYGLILGLVSVVAVGVLTTVGTDVSAIFTQISTDLQGAL